jgi:hypothetical protein
MFGISSSETYVYPTNLLVLGEGLTGRSQLDNKQDLCNLSLVSKNIYHLAIPYLYRTLVLGSRPGTLDDLLLDDYELENLEEAREAQQNDLLALTRRLVGNPNGQQAHAVREIEVLASWEHKEELVHLVKALPNLQHFRFVSGGQY